MAMTDSLSTVRLHWPDLATALAARIDYDPVSDTFLVAFAPGRPAAGMALETGDREYAYLRVDLDTEEIVGIEIEDVHALAIGRHPTWAPLIAAATEEPRSVPPALRSALAAFLADVLAMTNQ